MDWNLLLVFVVLNIVNVIIQTVKSLATVKCGKGVAALVNAIAYGLYTIVTVYMLCELDLWLKAGVVAVCNLIGVWLVKYFEEKARKDKIWKIECSVPAERVQIVKNWLKTRKLPFNYIEDVGNYTIFNIYCYTQEDSIKAKGVVEHFQLKYFVSESKTL